MRGGLAQRKWAPCLLRERLERCCDSRKTLKFLRDTVYLSDELKVPRHHIVRLFLAFRTKEKQRYVVALGNYI
jgi:hypothetical protein